jgi:hypothetical protein
MSAGHCAESALPKPIVCWTAGTSWREGALHSSRDQLREHPVVARLTGGPPLLFTQPQGRLVEAAFLVGG